MAIATLSIDLQARLAGLEAGMSRAQRVVEQSAQRMQASLQTVSAAASGVLGGLAGAATIGGLTQLFRSTVDGIDKLNDLADITGSTVERISALEDVALRTGASIDVVGDAMLKLNKELADGKPDSPTAQALRLIGLSAEELRNADPADALQQVAKALANYADDANKARLVQEIFGKSVREVGPFLKDLADAGQLNAKVTSEQAREAERFNKHLSELRAASTALSRSVVGDLLPALNAYLTLVQQLRAGPGIFAAAGEVLRGNVFNSAQEALDSYSAQIRKVDAQIAAIKADTRPLVRMTAEGEIAKLEAERARLAKFADAYRNTLNAGNAGGGRGTVSSLPEKQSVGRLPVPGAKAAEDRARSFTDYAMEISQALGKMVEDSDVVRIAKLNDQLAKLNELAAMGLDPQIVSDVRAMIVSKLPKTALDSPTEAFRRAEIAGTNDANAELAAANLARFNDERERLNRLLEATPSAVLQSQRDDMLALATALERGAITQAQFTEAAQARLGTLPKDLERTKGIAEELGMTFSSAFEDAIVGGKGLSGVLKGLEQDILRIITRKMVTEPLGNALSGMLGNAIGAGGGGNLFASLGNWFAGFFADGGTLLPGQWGIVGEQGPELAYGGTSGQTIVPMRGSAGGGGHSITVNVQAMPGASRASALQQGEIVGRQVQLALSRNG